MNSRVSLPAWLTVLALLAALMVVPSHHVTHASAYGVVISAVYGGGGGSSKADWRYDWVELFNAGSSPVNLNGWSIQYAAATQTTWNNWTYLPDVRLLPGQYFLIQEASDSNYGAVLPAPDFVNLSNPQNPHHIGSVSHKVALFSTTTRFTGGANPSGNSNLVDLVGYGSSNAYEGSGPVSPLNTERQAVRKNRGCTDTDQNISDFNVVDQFTPRNSSSPLRPCGSGTQLLTNSDFNGDANGDYIPDGWTVQNRTQDNMICNSADNTYAFAGKCAFQFTGGSGESAVLQQVVNIANKTFKTGDRLTLRAYVKAKNAKASIRLMVTVKYGGSTTPSKAARMVGAVGGYTYITVPTLTLKSGNVKKVIVQFKHKSTGSKVWLDGATLMLQKSGTREADAEPLPVPAAPVLTVPNN